MADEIYELEGLDAGRVKNVDAAQELAKLEATKGRNAALAREGELKRQMESGLTDDEGSKAAVVEWYRSRQKSHTRERLGVPEPIPEEVYKGSIYDVLSKEFGQVADFLEGKAPENWHIALYHLRSDSEGDLGYSKKLGSDHAAFEGYFQRGLRGEKLAIEIIQGHDSIADKMAYAALVINKAWNSKSSSPIANFLAKAGS